MVIWFSGIWPFTWDLIWGMKPLMLHTYTHKMSYYLQPHGCFLFWCSYFLFWLNIFPFTIKVSYLPIIKKKSNICCLFFSFSFFFYRIIISTLTKKSLRKFLKVSDKILCFRMEKIFAYREWRKITCTMISSMSYWF